MIKMGVRIMDGFPAAEASRLNELFGAAALDEASRRLEAATAARDHKSGIFYAEVCDLLIHGYSFGMDAVSVPRLA